MKNKNKFLLLLAFTSILSLVACQENTVSADEVSATVGVISVSATQSADPSSSDAIKTIRFIVFDYASSRPTLEVNELKDVTGASEISVTIGVTKHATNDKLLLTIANEPASMTSALNALSGTTAYSTLASLEVNFLQFLDTDLQTFLSDVKMPMTAAVWTDMVYANQQDAESNSVHVSLQRVAARVDVYAKTESTTAIQLNAGSSVELINTSSKGNFARHTLNAAPITTFGSIPTSTQSALSTSTWSLDTSSSIPLNQSEELLCSFYTSERTCSAADNIDKLKLSLTMAIDGEIAPRSGVFTLTEFTDESSMRQDIESILRNQIYKITLTLKDGSILSTTLVQDWNEERIEHEL